MKHLFAPGILLLALGGCGTDRPEPAVYCPQVAVLAQANQLTAYLPGRSDVAGQITAASITGVAGSCRLSKKNTLLTVQFQAGFAASNGPANHNAPVSLPYFVSISQGEHIVSKNGYAIALNFDGNVSTAGAVSKPVKIELANVALSAQTEILVGFQEEPGMVVGGQGQIGGN